MAQPAQRIEFYLRGGALIDATRGYAVPRQGECINIQRKCYRVAFVQWAIDTDPHSGTKDLRANIELEAISETEIGPIKGTVN